jgi:alkylation response protein AidB-like acyl-CoA dehydrogenase
MSGGSTSDARLQAENRRLAEQVRAFSGDEQLRREAAAWRDATPEERIAETWRLCALVPWFRSLWPEDVQRRADDAPGLPEDTSAILERMKRAGVEK